MGVAGGACQRPETASVGETLLVFAGEAFGLCCNDLRPAWPSDGEGLQASAFEVLWC